MRIAFRVLLGALALVVVLLVAVAIAVATVDVNRLVGPAQKYVRDATGRELRIDGGVELALSLTPKLVARGVELGNAPWGKAPALVKAKELEIELGLLPLLRRQFDVRRFRLVAPVIALETDARGRGNWEFDSPATAAPKAPAAADDATLLLSALAVGNLGIEEGDVTFRDGATGRLTSIRVDRLVLVARAADAPVGGEFRGSVDGIPVALTGEFGSLAALAQKRWPYPVALRGDVDGRKTEFKAGVRVEQRDLRLEGLEAGFGDAKLTGSLDVLRGGSRPKIAFRLTVPRYATTTLTKSAAGAAPLPPAGEWIFPDTAVPFEVLRAFDADGELAIGEAALGASLRLTDVRLKLALVDGRLDVADASANGLGGRLRARASVDARGATPALVVRLDADDVDAGALLALAGAGETIAGGKTLIAADLRLRGASPRQWARSAEGRLAIDVGTATLPRMDTGLESALGRVAVAVNPFRKVDPETRLQCASARLPFDHGVARIDRGIGIETSKVAISASGTIDLGAETLDLAVSTEARVKLPVDLPQLGDLVRVSGPLRAPKVGVHTAAAGAMAARIGAAFGTGGWSEVGKALLGRPSRGGPGPCATARGRG
jgi:AsmA family protein